jgi:hypothetical protein
MGVYLVGMHLTGHVPHWVCTSLGVYLIGMYLVGVHLTRRALRGCVPHSVYLMDVYLVGVYLAECVPRWVYTS